MRACLDECWISTHLAEVQDPRPHVSVAWALGDCTDELNAMISQIHAEGESGGVAGQGLRWSSQVSEQYRPVG